MSSNEWEMSRRSFLKGAAAVVVGGALFGCYGGNKEPSVELLAGYHDPIVVLSAYKEADVSNNLFISKSDWENYIEPTIGVLPTANNNSTVRFDLDFIRNALASNTGIIEQLGYAVNMREDSPDAASKGGIEAIANTTSTDYTDKYNSKGLGLDSKRDLVALFTSANNGITATTHEMVKEFFGSSVTARNYSQVWYNARDLTVNAAADLFMKFAVVENKPEIGTVYSGSVNVQNQTLVDAGYLSGVNFDADAYVTWHDASNNLHSLIVRIKHPNGKPVSNDESSAISLMQAAKQNGTYFYNDVLLVDLEQESVTGSTPADWKATSEGSIRYTIVDAIRKNMSGQPQTGGSSKPGSKSLVAETADTISDESLFAAYQLLDQKYLLLR